MRKIALFFLASLPTLGFSLNEIPWFGDVWEFELDAAYTYSRFTKVQSANHSLKHPFNVHLFPLDLGVALSENSEVQVEFELCKTTYRSFGFRSLALQMRRLWLDDIIGDPVSLATGVSLRGVSHISLRDISTPYHSYCNLEVNASVGKEWDTDAFWSQRVFGLVALGMAERGYPWSRVKFSFQGNHRDRHQYEIFTDGYFGFGPKNEVNVRHFHSYAFIHHQSIDLGLRYRYLFELWGALDFEYAYRIYAHSFPEQVNSFTFRYELPFSLF